MLIGADKVVHVEIIKEIYECDLNRPMKISRLRVSNLYSYEEGDLKLENYNVIVGPNAGGKTNLTRIINLLKGADQIEHSSLEYRKLPRELRFDRDKPSSVILDLNLSDYETKLLLQSLFSKDIDLQKFPDTIKRITLILYWTDIVSDEPYQKTLLRFANGFSIISSDGNRFMCYLDEIPSINLVYGEFSNLPTLGHSSSHVDVRAVEEGFKQKFGYPFNHLFEKGEFQETFLAGESIKEYFLIDGILVRMLSQARDVTYDYGAPRRYQQEIFDFTKARKGTGVNVNIWMLLGAILFDEIIIVNELRPSYDELAKALYDLRTVSGYEKDEEMLKRSFKEIFPNISFDARREDLLMNRPRYGTFELPVPDEMKPEQLRKKPGEQPPRITITEADGGKYPLEASASGYFEVLYLLASIANRKDSTIILDEPALHLHPTKILDLSKILRKMVTNSSNQVIVISHSPYFVDYEIAVKGRKSFSNLAYVIKQNNSSKILHRPDDLQVDLKPHLFTPEIFFARCSIVVEGPGDLATLAAISEAFDNILAKYDIALIYTWGKGSIRKYLPLLYAYKVPFMAMVDSDYQGQESDDVVKLKGNLEDELRKLGWDIERKKSKIEPYEAYEFVSSILINTNVKERIKKSIFWKVIESAKAKTGAESKHSS